MLNIISPANTFPAFPDCVEPVVDDFFLLIFRLGWGHSSSSLYDRRAEGKDKPDYCSSRYFYGYTGSRSFIELWSRGHEC